MNTLKLSIIAAGALRQGDVISHLTGASRDSGTLSSAERTLTDDGCQMVVTIETHDQRQVKATFAIDTPVSLLKLRELTEADHPEHILASLSILNDINVTGGIFRTDTEAGLAGDPENFDLAVSAEWLCTSLRKAGVQEACLIVDNDAAPDESDDE